MYGFTEYKVPLTLENAVTVPDNTDGRYEGEKTPEHTEPAFLEVSVDAETGQTPEQWIWLAFYTDDEPWFRLTFAETALLRDHLNATLEVYDALTDEQKAEVK